MLHLLQIMNHMLSHLEYSVAEVEEIFKQLEAKEFTVSDLLDNLGMELRHPAQLERLEASIPKWHSALAVTKMRLGME